MGSPLPVLVVAIILAFLTPCPSQPTTSTIPQPTTPTPPPKYLLHPSLLSQDRFIRKETTGPDTFSKPLKSEHDPQPIDPTGRHTQQRILNRFRRNTNGTEYFIKRFATIMDKIDSLMITLHGFIGHHGKYDEPCTYSVHSNPHNPKSSNLTTEDWLQRIEETRHNFARGLFYEENEAEIVYNLITSLDNSIEFAIEMDKKNETISLCDRFYYFKCNENNTCDCFSDEREEFQGESQLHYSGHKIATEFFPGVTILKDKVYPNGTVVPDVVITEGLCMIKENYDCPMLPSTLMCQPGTVCLTALDKKLCTLENLGWSFGLMMKSDKKFSLGFKELNKSGSNSRRRRAIDETSNHQIEKSLTMEELSDFSGICKCYDYGFCKDFMVQCKATSVGHEDDYDDDEDEEDYANVITGSVPITVVMLMISTYI